MLFGARFCIIFNSKQMEHIDLNKAYDGVPVTTAQERLDAGLKALKKFRTVIEKRTTENKENLPPDILKFSKGLIKDLDNIEYVFETGDTENVPHKMDKTIFIPPELLLAMLLQKCTQDRSSSEEEEEEEGKIECVHQ